MLFGSPAETAWPHGEDMLATIAPGKVLSSDAFSTFAFTKYASRSSAARAFVIPGRLFGGALSVPSYASQPCFESSRTASKSRSSACSAVCTAAAWLAPKPSAIVKVMLPPFGLPPATRAVWTMLPLLAVEYAVVSAREASSCVSPSLAVPAKPFVTSANGASRAA